MLLRLPWLLSRKRLLTAVALDFCLLYLVYFFSIYFSTSFWPPGQFITFLSLLLWVLSSYVIGRYQISKPSFVVHLFTNIFSSLFCLLLLLSSQALFLWSFSLFYPVSPLPYKSFPPFLLYAFLSSILQFLLAFLFSYVAKRNSNWLCFVPQKVIDKLNTNLEWCRLSASLIKIDDIVSVKDIAYYHNYAGLLIYSFHDLPLSTQEYILFLKNNGIPVLSINSWCEQVLQRFPPDLLSVADLLCWESSFAKGTIELRLKRLGDVLFSFLLLVSSFPFLLLVGFLIFLQDGGPVFYSQLRSGLNGSTFRIYKFRTMKVNSEENGAQWVNSSDSRITRIGHFLRLTRIDELPQLWSVLVGEMSLIGPRPERPEFDSFLSGSIPHYNLRYLMRPGLSGWAQVNYPYGASVLDSTNKLSYDIYYIRNFSFWLDFLIFFKTIRLVFRAKGAIPRPV